MGQKLNKW